MKSFLTMMLMSVLLAWAALFVYTTYVVPAGGPVVTEPAPPTPAEEAAQKATQANFTKKFQDVLDEFLHNVQSKAKEYKLRRKVVVELVKPENLGNPAYVQENQTMMESLIPELKTKMDEIMGEFSRAETEIRDAIAVQPPDKQQEILNKWRAVRDKQASHFLTFFASEQEVLQAYQDMMQFYKDRQGAYIFDQSTNSLLFNNPADKPQERELRERIKQLESKQMESIRRAGDVGADEEVQPVTPQALEESNMPEPTPQ